MPEFKQRVLERIRAIPGVKVIMEDRVIVEDALKGPLRFVPGKRTMQTEKGESIETDLIFLCLEGTPQTSFFPKPSRARSQRRATFVSTSISRSRALRTSLPPETVPRSRVTTSKRWMHITGVLWCRQYQEPRREEAAEGVRWQLLPHVCSLWTVRAAHLSCPD